MFYWPTLIFNVEPISQMWNFNIDPVLPQTQVCCQKGCGFHLWIGNHSGFFFMISIFECRWGKMRPFHYREYHIRSVTATFLHFLHEYSFISYPNLLILAPVKRRSFDLKPLLVLIWKLFPTPALISDRVFTFVWQKIDSNTLPTIYLMPLANRCWEGQSFCDFVVE